MRTVRLISTVIATTMPLTGIQAVVPVPAYACSCAITTDWALRLKVFGAIFAGEVINVGNAYNEDNDELLASHVITFKVYAAWKGVSTSQITIYSHKPSGANCGVGFEVGQRWLISTSGDGGGVSTCSLPMKLQQAGDAIAELGNPTYGTLEALYEPKSKTLLPDMEPPKPDPLGGLLPYILLFVLVATAYLVMPLRRRQT